MFNPNFFRKLASVQNTITLYLSGLVLQGRVVSVVETVDNHLVSLYQQDDIKPTIIRFDAIVGYRLDFCERLPNDKA